MKSLFSVSRKNFFKVLFVAAGLFLLWLLRSQLVAFVGWVGDRQAVTDTILRLGSWGPLALFLLLVLQVFMAIIPGHALVLAGGYVYGFALSLAITLSSTVLGSQIAFTIARRFGRRLIYRLASPRVIGRWDQVAGNQGGLFYFFTFVLPIFPSDLMCYVAGLGTVAPRRFFLANLCGRFVCSAFITLVGSRGFQMPVIFWALAILVMVGFYMAYLFLSRRSNFGLGPREALQGA